MTFSKSLSRALTALMLGVGLFFASAQLSPSDASAQCMTSSPTCSVVRPDGKAMIGLGLMGAELGLILPAAFGARDWWPYLVFPVLGGAGGAVGGYFLEQGTQNQPEISVTLLVIGAALIIPAVVGTLALTAYSPPTQAQNPDEDFEAAPAGGDSVEAVQDTADPAPAAEPAPAPAAEPAPAPQASLTQRVNQLYAGGPGFLRMENGFVFLAVPMISSRPTFTSEEVERLRVQQTNDVYVPVVSATF